MNPLRRERVLQQKSIHLISHRTGIDSSQISLIERGLKKATREQKKKLARALCARIRDLFPEEAVNA